MAFEDSHTLFVVNWLRSLDLEDQLEKWYSYRRKLFREKKKYSRKKVYSRLYEFLVLLIEEFPEREDEMASAYDRVLDDIAVEEKVEI